MKYEQSKYLRPEDVAIYARIGKSTVFKWLKVGLLKSHKVGRATFILREDVDKVIFGENGQ